MKTGIRKKLFYIIGFIFLIGVVGCTSDTFEIYDTNSSGELSQSEFEAAFDKAGWFAQYDKNSNDIFENNEFIFASFDYWDNNHDDILEEDEFDYGVGNFYYPYNYGLYGTYTDWDINDDNKLEEDEFEAAYVKTDIFKAADTNKDNSINKEEISNLVFRSMDENNDNELSPSEFQDDVLVRTES